MIVIFIIYLTTLVSLTFFSYGFVDVNFPVSLFPLVWQWFFSHRMLATAGYVVLISIFFGCYIWFLTQVQKSQLTKRTAMALMISTVGILALSYPAFSNDVFNYIATAKMTYYYRENPYITMPIEIPNEPMLVFMHAANKVALYGPLWIGLTAIPHSLGLGNLLMTMFTFKFFISCFYGLTVYLIWKLSKHNFFSTLFFALNPLVLIETFISLHNDVVMVFFAVWSFYLFSKKRLFLAGVALIASILIKYATVILIPVYCYLLFMYYWKRTINWQKIWNISALLMFVMVLLGPVREELYPWYFIWPLSFIALMQPLSWIHAVAIGFSFGLELRFAPYIFYREWGGWTPTIKKAVTIIPVFTTLIICCVRKVKRSCNMGR